MTITHPSDTLIHSSSLLSLLRGDYLPLSLSLALWERHSARRKWPLSIRGEWCTWESIASAFSATIRRAPAAPASAAYLSIDLIHFPLKKKKRKRNEMNRVHRVGPIICSILSPVQPFPARATNRHIYRQHQRLFPFPI